MAGPRSHLDVKISDMDLEIHGIWNPHQIYFTAYRSMKTLKTHVGLCPIAVVFLLALYNNEMRSSYLFTMKGACT